MDTRIFSAHNQASKRTLSVGLTVVDAAREPLKVLKILMEGLPRNAPDGLWLVNFKGVPVARSHNPYDLVYLDEHARVVQAIEISPASIFEPFTGSPASALILPSKAVARSRTFSGDIIMVTVVGNLAEPAPPPTPPPAPPRVPVKTTVVRTPARVVAPSTGHVTVGAQPVASGSMLKSKSAVIVPPAAAASAAVEEPPAPAAAPEAAPAVPLEPAALEPAPQQELVVAAPEPLQPEAQEARPEPAAQAEELQTTPPEVPEAPSSAEAVEPATAAEAEFAASPAETEPYVIIVDPPVEEPAVLEVASEQTDAVAGPSVPEAEPVAVPEAEHTGAPEPEPAVEAKATPAEPAERPATEAEPELTLTIAPAPGSEAGAASALAGLLTAQPVNAAITKAPMPVLRNTWDVRLLYYFFPELHPGYRPEFQAPRFGVFNLSKPREENHSSLKMRALCWLYPDLQLDTVHLRQREARRAPRVANPGLIGYFFTGGTSEPNEIRSLSVTGFFMKTKERWMPGTVIRVTLQMANSAGEEEIDSITVHARAVNWNDEGGGFEFVLPGFID